MGCDRRHRSGGDCPDPASRARCPIRHSADPHACACRAPVAQATTPRRAGGTSRRHRRSDRTADREAARCREGTGGRARRSTALACGERNVRAPGARRHGVVQRLSDDVPAARAVRLPPQASRGESSRDPHRVRTGRR